jgi:hypothetical protein
MKLNRIPAALLCPLLFCSISFADTDVVAIRRNLSCPVAGIETGSPKSTPLDISEYGRYLDTNGAAILSVTDGKALVKGAIEKAIAEASDGKPLLDAKDLYVLIHVVHWGSKNDKGMTADKQNWYVYSNGSWRQEDFADRKRLYGTKNVWILYIHTGIPADTDYAVQYNLAIKDITPAPVSHLFDLASLLAGSTSAKAASPPLCTKPTAIWGMAKVGVKHVPDEISVRGSTETAADILAGKAPQSIGDAVTFVNEGRYWIDFSVAVPMRSISQASFDATSGTITPKNVNSQNILGVVDFYPFKKVDVRSDNYTLWPYLLGGVAIAHQPLHKILIGAGWGPRFAQFYVGALFVKQNQVAGIAPGTAATPAQVMSASRMAFDPQLSIGLNLQVRSLANLLKQAK